MKIAVLTHRSLRQYFLDVCRRGGAKIAAFPNWSDRGGESFSGVPTPPLEKLRELEFDILLVGMKPGLKLTQILPRLRNMALPNAYILRSFPLETRESFLREGQLDPGRVNPLPGDGEKPFLPFMDCWVWRPGAAGERKPIDKSLYERVMKDKEQQISALGTLILRGEEPLLEPETCRMLIGLTHRFFPGTEILIQTDGTLIPDMEESFWDCLRENEVILRISAYPETMPRLPSLAAAVKKRGIRCLTESRRRYEARLEESQRETMQELRETTYRKISLENWIRELDARNKYLRAQVEPAAAQSLRRFSEPGPKARPGEIRLTIAGNLRAFLYDASGLFLPAGNALISAAAACRCPGISVGILGAVGDDLFGGMILDAAAARPIIRENLHIVPGAHTGYMKIFLDENGDRSSMNFWDSAGESFRPDESDAACLRDSDYVLIPHSSHLLPWVLEKKRESRFSLAVDFDDRRDFAAMEELLPNIEIAFLSGQEEDLPVFREWSARFGILVNVTMAEKGSVTFVRGHEIREAAIPAENVVDTTGCGNCYHAAFLCSYARDGDISAAMRSGSRFAYENLIRLGCLS